MQYAKLITDAAYRSTAEDVQRLRDHGWTEDQISEAVYVIAMFAFFNRVADAFGDSATALPFVGKNDALARDESLIGVSRIPPLVFLDYCACPIKTIGLSPLSVPGRNTAMYLVADLGFAGMRGVSILRLQRAARETYLASHRSARARHNDSIVAGRERFGRRFSCSANGYALGGTGGATKGMAAAIIADAICIPTKENFHMLGVLRRLVPVVLVALISMSAWPSDKPPDPANAAKLNNLGVAYMNQQRMDKAVEEFDQALKADPGLTAAELNKGIALLNLQKLPEAEAALDARRQPRNLPIRASGTTSVSFAAVKASRLKPSKHFNAC